MADALQNAIPFAARHRGTSALIVVFDALLIDCLIEWEDIYAGRLDEIEINRRRHRMMKLRHDAGVKALPSGLPVKKALFLLAESDAAAYFQNTYETRPVP